MKRLVIAITALSVLALLGWAVLRAQGSRELILKSNGLPLANLKGEIMPGGVAGSLIVPTRTDAEGRLDLSGVPGETRQINVSLRDSAGNVRVHNTLFQVPTNGSRVVVDFQGSRTIRTTTTTYADFGFYQLTRNEVLTWDEGMKTRNP